MNDYTQDSATSVSDSTPSLTTEPSAVVGIDVGDRWSRFCKLDPQTGDVVKKGRVASTAAGLSRLLGDQERLLVVIEVGTHSPWMSRNIQKLGHEVIVANARKLRAIYQSDRKNDELDALMLARLGRVDPKLLCPIQHRGGQAQSDLAIVRAREELVACRTKLINSVRGMVKSFGERLPSCSAATFHKRAPAKMPKYLAPALTPLVEEIEQLTVRIRDYDRLIAATAKRYPDVERLREVAGVGPITALTFVLTLEDPKRFKSARSVGAYLGLVPKLDESGDQTRQLRITKSGDARLRSLLVNCAHYILGPFGTDSDLRRFGARIAKRGGKNGKKRAVIAVARKLSVLLLALWAKQTPYESLRQASLTEAELDSDLQEAV